MRFLDLHLLRFGHFSDRTLEFDRQCGLHVIFGRNEAGKSTTLRAVAGVLFGIPENTGDHHAHDMRELRIGARLRNRRGDEIHIVRRKGRQNTLLDSAENPLDDALLYDFIGATTRELFTTMFGLNHGGLLSGGQALLEGKGELGESLFGAGLGVRGIHAMRGELEKQAGLIFAPRGKNPKLNQAISRFKEAKKAISEQSLRPREWQDKQKELHNVETQRDELQRQHADLTTRLSRLQRLQRTLPNLQRRRLLSQQMENLGDVPVLADDAGEQRRAAQETLRRIELQRNKYHDEQLRCRQARAGLDIPEALLTQADELEQLRDMLARQRAARRDMPGVREKLTAAREDIGALLRELGRNTDLDFDEAERLIVDVAAQTRIRQLSQEGIRLATELSNMQQDIAAGEHRHEQLSAQLAQLPAGKDAGALRRLLAEINKQGDMPARLEELTLQDQDLQQRLQQQLIRLTLWQGSPEQAAQLPLPLAETVLRYEHYFQQLFKDRQRLELQQENARRQLAEIDTRVNALQLQGTVPSEQLLQHNRVERDQHWQHLRTAWLNGDPASEQQLDDYESHVGAADHTADQLRIDADRAARYAGLISEQERYQSDVERLDRDMQELQDQAEILERQWGELWQPCGIEPLPPAEMKRWLERHERLLETWLQQQQQALQCASLQQKIIDYQRRLQQQLEKLEAIPDAAPDAWPEWLQHAEQAVERLDAQSREHQQLQRDLKQLERARDQQQQVLAQCRPQLQQWQQQWREALAPLDLDDSAGAAEAEAVLNTLGRLAGKLEDARRYRTRIEQMQAYEQQFNERVALFCRDYADDLLGEAATEAVPVLTQRLNRGNSDLRERDTLERRLQQIKQELSELEREHEAALATLDGLMAATGVDTVQALEQVEQRAHEQRRLTIQLQEIEQQLGAEGLALKALEDEAQHIDPDTLPGDGQALQLEVEELSRQLQQCHQHQGRLQTELAAMENAGGAADAALDAQSALSDINHQVENYVRLKLCALILNREIERYREQNQAPVMQRAGELFRHMTLESFSGLGSVFDDNDQLVLRCVRASGERVAVDGLSEGSRDQLYLALRLASLELHAERNEPLPLVVDDILINFDDERARATLEVLAGLAGKTQILFFTHHARLLELAREAVSETQLQVCTL